jgi:hypothetical protein
LAADEPLFLLIPDLPASGDPGADKGVRMAKWVVARSSSVRKIIEPDGEFLYEIDYDSFLNGRKRGQA